MTFRSITIDGPQNAPITVMSCTFAYRAKVHPLVAQQQARDAYWCAQQGWKLIQAYADLGAIDVGPWDWKGNGARFQVQRGEVIHSGTLTSAQTACQAYVEAEY